MDSKERAENIKKMLLPLVDLGPSIVEFIAAQIEEAEREAVMRWALQPRDFKTADYAEGFKAARESAAKALEDHCSSDEYECGDVSARIRALAEKMREALEEVVESIRHDSHYIPTIKWLREAKEVLALFEKEKPNV